MMTTVLQGIGATPRSGVGTVLWHDPDHELPAPPAPEAVDATAERERFAAAQDEARAELEAERERLRERVGEAEADVFAAHVQFLDDPQLVDPVEANIDDGLPAEHAVVEGFEDPIAQFEAMDGRMAERADDLRDVRDRLVRVLTGTERVDLGSLPEDTVLLAERLTPSDTAQLDPEAVSGFATVVGGRTSHAAIFARSLGIPAVVGVGETLSEVPEGVEAVVDGDAGEIITDPDDDARARATREQEIEIREEPVATTDGHSVEVAANIGTLAELEPAAERGADGVGLFRTEFLFLDRRAPPDEQEQFEAYTDALDVFPDGRVVVRTLDIGGDKQIPYLDLPDEVNPFLGSRGIRRSLGPDRDLFESQLRTLLRAAAVGAGDLAVMFPMVATVEELDEALSAVESVAVSLEEAGVAYEVPELGVMIETPGAAFMAPELAERVDFLSVGTNDLIQYVVAAARENERVADLHDPRYPAVLRAIRRCVDAADGTDTWVGMCGEMAGAPELTQLLVGLGLDELSMSAVTVPEVKANVAATDRTAARELAARALDASTKQDVERSITETLQ